MTFTLIQASNLAFPQLTGYLEPVTFPDPAGSWLCQLLAVDSFHGDLSSTPRNSHWPCAPGWGWTSPPSPCIHLILFTVCDFAHCSSLSTCSLFSLFPCLITPTFIQKIFINIQLCARHWSTVGHFLFLQPWKVVTVTSIFIYTGKSCKGTGFSSEG